MADPKSLKERVEEAQALLSNAPAGPYEVLRMPEDDTPTIFIGTPQDWQADVIPRLFSGGEATHWHRREEQWSVTDLLAAAPDLVALVTELWTAYMAACDRADGRDQLEANERADAAARKAMGVRLGLQSADDSPSCLADFEDAIIEARAERDAALANADRLRHTLAVALARFTEPGHIRAAGDCLRTGWVPSGLVNEWRALAEVTRG